MSRFATVAVIALLAGSAVAQSQAEFPSQFWVGAKGGASMSRVAFSPSVPQSMRNGMVAGVTARYITENHFGLIAEVNVEQRGWKEKFEDEYAGNSYDRSFTYLQIPILTHIYFGSNRVHGFFNAGPELGYMLGSSTSSNFDYPSTSITNRYCDQWTLEVKNKFDYGISAGVGMEVFLGNKQSVVLEGRFYYGLNDVFSNHKTDPFSASNSMSVMVTLGWNYRIK